jgi:hypothetical protein
MHEQSRTMSFVEATANVVAGFTLALLTQIMIFPLFAISASVVDNVLISCAFTAVSLLRGFALRRVFEAVRCRQAKIGQRLAQAGARE